MTRPHRFASGLTICVSVAILCLYGMHYSLDLGMIGVVLAALIFYPGALLLGHAIWPSDRATKSD